MITNKIITFFLLLFITSTSYALTFDHEYKRYGLLLKSIHKVVGHQALVNYSAIKKDPKVLDGILSNFTSVSEKQYSSFSKDQKLAFLINSYNAFTIKLIVDHYPVKSIKDVGSLFTSAWKKKFFMFLGKKRYLDDIEHNMIRKDFNEPRIHFAVVCASIGCPNLYPKPFLSKKLEAQLEESSMNFLSDPGKNSLDISGKKIRLSKIFKWYGKDFDKKYGGYLNFIGSRITKKINVQSQLKSGHFKQSWNDYNWDLNKW